MTGGSREPPFFLGVLPLVAGCLGRKSSRIAVGAQPLECDEPASDVATKTLIHLVTLLPRHRESPPKCLIV